MRCLKPGGKLVCAEYEIDFSSLDQQLVDVYDYWVTKGSLYGLRQFDKGEFVKNLEQAGFNAIKQEDWTDGVLPSFKRIYRLALLPDKVISALGLKNHSVNTVAAKGYYLGAKRGHFKYKLYSALKPKN